MRLSDMQALFAHTMLDHTDAVANPDPLLAGLFAGSEKTLPERLKIYRNNIVCSLSDAMLATYPLIKTLTGVEFATALMRSFVLENPPREACLARYGAGLDAFIETFTPAKDLRYLPDVARLEWAMNEAYYASDDRPLAPEDLQSQPAENLSDLSLRPRSSVRLLASPWPLESIRTFCLNYREDSDETLNLDQGDSRLMVFRPRLSVEVVSLDHDEYVWLEFLAEGQTLGAALESVFKVFPSFNFQGCLQEHLQLETFSAL
jgi:hypothetical protein